MTLDDYLGARMISSPLCLYDCDFSSDGAAALIVSAAETARDLRRPPVRIEAAGTALKGRHSWDQWEDLTTMGCRDAAAMMWSRTDLGPSDVDFAWVYDGFSILALQWIEALGFCKKGEGGPFIEGGHRIAFGGELPINTDGGQLSAYRLHGYGGLHEACLQLWGEAESHQLLRPPEVAVVGVGACTMCASLLLTKT
jgi:acetyl-CoA acetyltransferase